MFTTVKIWLFGINEKFKILLCQEIHISSDQFDKLTTSMHHKLLYYESLWTHYCSIINFNPSILMVKVHEFVDGRFLLAKFSLVSNSIPPFYILNLSAPVEHNIRSKNTFFSNIINMTLSLTDFESIILSMIVTGNFNYSLDNSSEHFSVTNPINNPLLIHTKLSP